MRAFHGQNTRRNTPRPTKRGSPRSWSLVESAFIRAVVEVVLEPGLGSARKAIQTVIASETTNPGSYLTDVTNNTQEFPLDLAAELLVQRGATERWFRHRWTTGYAKSYLSEWGNRNYDRQSKSRIADTFCHVFSPIPYEQEHPFCLIPSATVVGDEKVAHQSLSNNLLDIIPGSPSCPEDLDGVEVNMDAENIEERQIY